MAGEPVQVEEEKEGKFFSNFFFCPSDPPGKYSKIHNGTLQPLSDQ